jgi:protein-S-isoprenylcysteine O-methyltransferase Ste14
MVTNAPVTISHLPLPSLIGICACWAAFGLAWLAGAAYNSSRAPAQRTQTPFGSSVLMGAVIVVIVDRIVPRSTWGGAVFHSAPARFAGLAILVASTAFTLWARGVLGTMWSMNPAVKEEHRLRTSGPYAVTRHPIYTGILGMLLGTALAGGGGVWIVPFPVFVVLFEIKLRFEERLMLAEFPDDYPAYRRRVPQLVPGLRLPRRQVAADS